MPGIARNTFLIDSEGAIGKVYTRVNPAPHSEEVLKALSEMEGNLQPSVRGSVSAPKHVSTCLSHARQQPVSAELEEPVGPEASN